MNIVGRTILIVIIGLIQQNAIAACFSVYDIKGSRVYFSQRSPVDMSKQIHETLPSVYPDSHLVFDLSDMDCPETQEDFLRRIASDKIASSNILPVPNYVAPIIKNSNSGRLSDNLDQPIRNVDHAAGTMEVFTKGNGDKAGWTTRVRHQMT